MQNYFVYFFNIKKNILILLRRYVALVAKVTFLNHSSVLVDSGKTNILCDPWFLGLAFMISIFDLNPQYKKIFIEGCYNFLKV